MPTFISLSKNFWWRTVCVVLLLTAAVQAQTPCAKNLAEAREKYLGAHLQEAIHLIESCLNSGQVSENERMQAYELAVPSYYKSDQRLKAKANLRKLLAIQPNWRPADSEIDKEYLAFVNREIDSFHRENELQKLRLRTPEPPVHIPSRSLRAELRAAVSDKANPPEPLAVEIQAPQPEHNRSTEPNKLFLLSDASSLPSLAVDFGFGSNIGFTSVDEEQRVPLLWHLRFGLGDIAELEFGSTENVNGLQKGRPELLAASFKISLPEEEYFKNMPALAVVIHRHISSWNSDTESIETQRFEFNRKFSEYQLIASKSLESVRLHAGFGWRILKFNIRNPDILEPECDYVVPPCDSLDDRPDPANIDNAAADETKWYLGLQWRLNAYSSLMAEHNYLAEYHFSETQPLQNENTELILTDRAIWLVGIRLHPMRGLAFDAGVMWRTNLDENDDERASFRMGLNISASVPGLIRKASSVF